jgi:16S rRNA (uracil1498-N3)-methyltransferase
VNLFYQPLIPQGALNLDPDESRHAIKVLRKRNGDLIRVTDGKGVFYEGIITDADAHQCTFSIHSTVTDPEKNFRIHIGISPTKNADRIEWFVEKVVEFGVDEITLLQCDHTERQHLKVERLNKTAISAMKQSLKAKLPVIHPISEFKNVVMSTNDEQKYIAHVDERNQQHLQQLVERGLSYLVLIGPEGDFSTDELKLADAHGFKKVSLGPSRLRTETAGIAACHILNLANTP